MNLDNVIIKENTAFLYMGGGIASQQSGLTLANVTISGNTAASFGGGGIFSLGDNLSMTDVTVSENIATFKLMRGVTYERE
ncbi:hypothetical protein [Paenibacillus naphthalenovorans]|uniref:Right handed beta helix domain-containing protein n=1 Tax=Paenibacillus naphthalenovorans TaxID=162209 RepID=A0A0U2VZZ7_9BACL|nr:hypothetical protein [Paenibacillus naphthalenovorans]ALS25047.1 hypothetical protein IJ22_47850 [Paenibacillus naphthalenovorans]